MKSSSVITDAALDAVAPAGFDPKLECPNCGSDWGDVEPVRCAWCDALYCQNCAPDNGEEIERGHRRGGRWIPARGYDWVCAACLEDYTPPLTDDDVLRPWD